MKRANTEVFARFSTLFHYPPEVPAHHHVGDVPRARQEKCSCHDESDELWVVHCAGHLDSFP